MPMSYEPPASVDAINNSAAGPAATTLFAAVDAVPQGGGPAGTASSTQSTRVTVTTNGTQVTDGAAPTDGAIQVAGPAGHYADITAQGDTSRVYAEERHIVDINVGLPKGTRVRQTGTAPGVTINTGYGTAKP